MRAIQVGIVGAGAIGRGFVPWLFEPRSAKFHLIEKDPVLTKGFSLRGGYTTHKASGGGYVSQRISVESISEKISQIPRTLDLAVVAVGTRAFPRVVEEFPAVDFPIICMENDPGVVEIARKIRPDLKIFFAVPDVIASSTAPDFLLREDPHALVTESGTCFIEENHHLRDLETHLAFVDAKELETQWRAKLYLHNTPHCIAAYLGHAARKTYLHEALSVNIIRGVIEGATKEMVQMVRSKFSVDRNFLENYGLKELTRFKNELLCDPVSRVAREPFRKLQPRERLIGAAQIALSVGVFPDQILTGIVAASTYDQPGDADSHIRLLSDGMPPASFIEVILGISRDTALFDALVESWADRNYVVRGLDA